jgi:hypothetical protein
VLIAHGDVKDALTDLTALGDQIGARREVASASKEYLRLARVQSWRACSLLSTAALKARSNAHRGSKSPGRVSCFPSWIDQHPDPEPFLPPEVLSGDQKPDASYERLIFDQLHEIEQEPRDGRKQEHISMVPGVAVADYLETDNRCEQEDRKFQRHEIIRIKGVRIEDSEQCALKEQKKLREQRDGQNQKTQERIVFWLEAEEQMAVFVKREEAAEFPPQTLTAQTPEI